MTEPDMEELSKYRKYLDGIMWKALVFSIIVCITGILIYGIVKNKSDGQKTEDPKGGIGLVD